MTVSFPNMLQASTVNVMFLPETSDDTSTNRADFVWTYPGIPEGGRQIHDMQRDRRQRPHDDVWTRRISKMRIYSGERMESDLREAGFRSVDTYRKDGRSWICVIARKRDRPGASENDMK